MVGVIPHLQCSAGLHHPIISQLSVKGAGPEADDSQGEFSVRQSECEREKSERESAREAVVPCAPGLSLQKRLYVSLPLFLPPSFHSAPSLLFHSSSLCHPFLCSLCFSLLPADRRLCFVLYSYFSLSIRLLFFLSVFCLIIFSLVDGVRGFFFQTPAVFPALLPLSHPMGIRASCR